MGFIFGKGYWEKLGWGRVLIFVNFVFREVLFGEVF